MTAMRTDTLLLERSPGELRAAALCNGEVLQVDHWRDIGASRVGATYLARVRRLDIAINAAFMDLGDGADGFLRGREVARSPDAAQGSHVRINRLLHEGAAFPVQIVADGHGEGEAAKGPGVTSFVRLRGRIVDLRPSTEGLVLPDGVGGAARRRIETLVAPLLQAGEGAVLRDIESLPAEDAALVAGIAADLARLRTEWAAIALRAEGARAPVRLDPGPGAVARAMADLANADLGSVLCGDGETAAAARRWAARYLPALEGRIEAARAPANLFETQGVEAVIEGALAPRVALPGGGELVFEPGETLTAVDVNSGSHAGSGMKLARDVNIEAVVALGRQLRLRALAGAIVVDALKMTERHDRAAVLEALRETVADDPAGVVVHGWTVLGFIELTRARRGPSLAARLQESVAAPQASAVALGYAALRRLLAAARAHPAGGYAIQVAPEVADAIAGPLAAALAEALGTVGGNVIVAGEPARARESIEVMVR
ncbi:MAG: ribonuclease E/G [Alphaproteobacteria bacterium]|nr:ribonuclease E/G [Alphaproteobacteria bacterium]